MGTLAIISIALVAVGWYLVWNILKILKEIGEYEL